MEDKLHSIRHSLSHLLAAAIKERYPHAKLGIGPVIENGFYYDFDFSGGEAPSQQDFAKLEKTMRKMIAQKQAFKRSEAGSEEAEKLFASEPFKRELIRELVAAGEKLSIYKNGDFTDLCAGPHVADTSEIPAEAFVIDRLAGAYWKGSEKNQMLTRIYGLAFLTKEALDEYVKIREEAEKRDHRKLAKELDLFMISEDVGKGLPLWLPNGAFIRRRLEDYMYAQEYARGYKYVYTPVLTHRSLYEKSGHLAHYHEDMYSPIDIEGEQYYLKPMNCPHHHMIYRNRPLSYRDLPLRLAEFGFCHRFERSGVLTGLIRARCFTQNDAHIYCAKSDLRAELIDVLKLFKDVYSDFRIDDFWFRLSLPDFSNAEKYGDIQDKKMWEDAGAAAKGALEEFGAKYVIGEGEASFYGPKIDVQVKNVAGKEDTIATAQVDFYSANKFNLTFTNQDGQEEKPVIIHRAVMGSFDRFFAFLTEQTGGAYPVWLAPLQAKILPISDKQEKLAYRIEKELKTGGVRAEVDRADESLGKRIRTAKMQKTPYLIVLGEKEDAEGLMTVESRAGRSEKMSAEDFIAKIRKEEEEKT
jgi:threonyl-tRNA synthetase